MPSLGAYRTTQHGFASGDGVILCKCEKTMKYFKVIQSRKGTRQALCRMRGENLALHISIREHFEGWAGGGEMEQNLQE